MSEIQYVTLVAAGGTPIRLSNQTGAPYPTTGSGALVFASSPELNSPILNSPTWVGPETIDGDFTVDGDLDVSGNIIPGQPQAIETGWYAPIDGTDATDGLNEAFDVARERSLPLKWTPGTYGVRESSPGSGYALLNEGVSCIGSPRLQVQIRPLPSMPDTADFMLIRPLEGHYSDFLQIAGLYFNTNPLGTVRGRYCIKMLFDRSGQNLGSLDFSGNYFSAGNNYSLLIENPVFNTTINTTNLSATATVTSAASLAAGMTIGSANVPSGTTILNIVGTTLTMSAAATSTAGPTNAVFAYNFQGIPSNAVFSRNYFGSGCRLTGVGDSIHTYANVLRGANIGWSVYQINVAGVAGEWLSQGDNIDCEDGAFKFDSANAPKIRDCNIELSAGAGSSAAVVDFDGGSEEITLPEITGCHIGVFGSATATRAIRFGNTLGGVADNNQILGIVNYGVDVTASAVSTKIGPGNRYSVVTAAVLNNGGVTTQTNGVPFLAYTPTVTSEGGTITTSSATGFYQLWGKWMTVYGTVTITTVGTATGSLYVTVPVAALRACACGGGKEIALTGAGVAGGFAGATNIVSFRYADAATILASGAVVNFTVAYEIA